MLISLLDLKLAAVLAKDMVNLDTTRRVSLNLFYAGKQFLLSALQNDGQEATSEIAPRTQITTTTITTSTEYLVHNWLESLFSWFQIVILWHEPLISLCAIGGLLSSFLLLTYFAPRFYTTIMIAIFCYNLTKVWFKHIWPEIRVPPSREQEEEARIDVDRWTLLHPQLMTLKELQQLLRNLTTTTTQLCLPKLLQMRRQQPGAFCLGVCSFFTCTAYLGSRVSDLGLLCCAIATLVLAPGIYLYLLPNVAQDYLRRHYQSLLDGQPKEESQANCSPLSSLFEHLRRYGLVPGQQQSLASTSLPVRPDLSSVASQGADDLTEQVPTSGEDQHEKPAIQGDNTRRPSSARCSDNQSISDGSTSWIESDDETCDGFVMLHPLN